MHKSQTIYNWKRRGLKPEQVEYAWEQIEQSTECEWCGNKYKSNTDKCMDHCYIDNEYYEKGDYRNILCQTCNKSRRNNTKFITYRQTRDRYRVQVIRNGKNIVELPCQFQTREEAEARLQEFKENNPIYFIPDYFF